VEGTELVSVDSLNFHSAPLPPGSAGSHRVRLPAAGAGPVSVTSPSGSLGGRAGPGRLGLDLDAGCGGGRPGLRGANGKNSLENNFSPSLLFPAFEPNVAVFLY